MPLYFPTPLLFEDVPVFSTQPTSSTHQLFQEMLHGDELSRTARRGEEERERRMLKMDGKTGERRGVPVR